MPNFEDIEITDLRFWCGVSNLQFSRDHCLPVMRLEYVSEPFRDNVGGIE